MEVIDSGEARLKTLGYKQELKRDFNIFTNGAISFSIISILTGVTGSLGLAINNSGPVGAVWGWVFVSVMTMTVGLSMAEIVSSLPTSGGPYFWSAQLSTPEWSPFAAWMTGWFNLLGQAADTASINYMIANQIASMWLLSTGHPFTQLQLLACYTIVLVLHACLNCLPTKSIAHINGFSAVWHLVGTFVLIVLLPAVAPTHQSASYVFTSFSTDTAATSVPSAAYLFINSILLSQFTLSGYDACGHLSEETARADVSAPIGVIMALGVSAVIGWLYILALLFSIQNVSDLQTGIAAGYTSGQIFYDVFNARYGSGTGGVIAMGIPLVAMFFCGASSITSNSRMLWSFSRDGAVPGWRLWSAVNPVTQTPLNAVLLMVTLAFIMGLPMIHSTAAFSAVVSISTIGLYISYAIPIFIRLLNSKSFEPGPVSLGRYGRLTGAIAVIWVVFISVVFVIPPTYPVTSVTLNYAPVAVGMLFFGALIGWFMPCGLGGRYWFRGARHTIEETMAAELAKPGSELYDLSTAKANVIASSATTT